MSTTAKPSITKNPFSFAPTKVTATGEDSKVTFQQDSKTDPGPYPNKPEEKRKEKLFYIELDTPGTRVSGQGPTAQEYEEVETEEPDSNIHWYFGDLTRRLTVMNKYEEKIKSGKVPDPNNQEHITDFNVRKSSCLRSIRDCLCPQGPRRVRCTDELKEKEEQQENLDRKLFWARLIIVVFILCIEYADYGGYLGNWTLYCQNNSAQHFYNCMDQTKSCSKILENQKLFYCTKKDFDLGNKNFCKTGYCSAQITDTSSSGKWCVDPDFKARVDSSYQLWQQCYYRKDQNHSCAGQYGSTRLDYGDCGLGIEIFQFVFMVKDVLIDEQLDPITKKIAVWVGWAKEGGSIQNQFASNIFF